MLASWLLLAGTAAYAQADAVKPPDNFISWRTGLSSAAQPQRHYLEQAAQLKYEVVINLAPPQSWGSIENEGALIGRQGLAYVNLPVDFEDPVLRDFELFSGMMKASAGKNILVHCQANFRGASFVFLYRVIHENIPIQEAAAKLNAVWAPNVVWKKFIQQTLAHYGHADELL
ncbi:MAG: protein tyrosine phosphatase family protein [Pseudomonadota bacterium]